MDQAEAELEKLKKEAGLKRNHYTEAKAALDGIERDIRGRQSRIKSIGEERLRWLQRTKSANAQISSLEERLFGVEQSFPPRPICRPRSRTAATRS